MARKRNSISTKPQGSHSTTKADSPSASLSSNEDTAEFRPLFDKLFEGSVNQKVDPFCCIPFANIREVTESGVQRLMSLFDDRYEHVDQTPSSGLALGSDIPIVVKMEGSLMNYVHKYLADQGKSKEEVKSIIVSHEHWYGIVDGLHHNCAVRRLKESNERWESVLWYVTVIRGGNTLEEYERLARFQNHRHSEKYFIEVTFYDQLHNLKKDFERLQSVKRSVTQKEVAQSYFGFKHVNRTMTMLASVAIRLSSEVVKELGKIMNSMHPNIYLKNEAINSSGAKTEQEVMASQDCRIYRSFLRLNSLYSSKSFMNHNARNGIEAQINALHRLKDVCSLNDFTTVQHETVTEQYKLANEALQEEKKFLNYLEMDKWPNGMENIRNNLLRTTSMDDEITLNRGNDQSILDSLHSALQRMDPQLAAGQDEKLRHKTESLDNNKSCTQSTSPDPPSAPSVNPSNEGEEDKEPTPSRDELEKVMLEEDRSRLRSKGITCYNMSHEEYVKTEWKENDEKMDLVMSEPPSSPSRSPIHSSRSTAKVSEEMSLEEVKNLPKILKRVLKVGGYVVLVMRFYSFMEWYEAFYSAGYEVMSAPYILAFDSKTIQLRRTKIFPMLGYKVALVAQLPSGNRESFEPNFDTPFNLVNCSNSRRCGVMYNISDPKSKLYKPETRVPFHPEELSPFMLSELIDLFTPQNGRVLDPFAGTMTSAIAAMQTGRTCICVERNDLCYNESFNRLRSYLPSSTNIINLDPASLLNKKKASNNLTNDINDVSSLTTKETPDSRMQLTTDSDTISTSTPPGLEDGNQNDAQLLLNVSNNGQSCSVPAVFEDKEFFGEDIQKDTVECPSLKRPLPRQDFYINSSPQRYRYSFINNKGIEQSKWYKNKRVMAPNQSHKSNSTNNVVLLVDKEPVGFASLQQPASLQDGNAEVPSYVTRLHNHELSKWQTGDQKLVVIVNTTIHDSCKNVKNPYALNIGIEEPPETLGDMFKSGLYPWDLKMLQEQT